MEDKVYTPSRQRTITLVKQSVDALHQERQRVSLASVVARSKELDPEHRGVSESAILGNKEARAYYEKHRTWQAGRKRRIRSLHAAAIHKPGQVKLDRDEGRARQRYMRMNKEILVERLLSVERMLAEKRERWLSQQDDLLTWRLRAEAAEAQLTQEHGAPDFR